MANFAQASAFGFSGWDPFATHLGRKWDEKDRDIANQFSAQQAQQQMDFQERMSNTSVQRSVADMKAAGINPMLSVHPGGGASTPPGAGFAGQKANRPSFPGASGNVTMQTAAQVNLMEAEANRANAEAENLRGPTRENIKQQTEESIARVDKTLLEMHKIGQDTATSAAQQRNLEEQTRNLRETGVQIRETVNLLRAQQKATGEMAGLSAAQSAEVRQRINANLPRLEAMIKQLEQLTREAALPKQQQDASFYKRTAGQILRNISNTLKNIFGKGN